MPAATRGMSALGTRRTILVGLLIFAWGAWWMGSLNQYVGYWEVFWPRVLQGFALGFIFVPLSTATLSEIPQGEMASASGIYTLVRQLGGGIGIAVLELLILRREESVHSLLAGSVTLSHPAVARMMSSAANHAQAVAQLNGIVEQNAATIAYNYVFRICAFVFLATIPTLMLLRPGKAKGEVAVTAE
jgi:DHA2 family multidrug resistance protein